MNWKVASILAICAAVIAAGVSCVVVSMNRNEAARHEADRAASEETAATKRARAAESERATAAAKAREAEANAESEKAAARKAEAERDSLQKENENLAAKKAIAVEERAAADAEAQKAADVKAAKEIELKIARQNAEAERAKEAASANELARTEATKAIREAETMKLRVSMAELEAEKQRYQELNAELVEYQKELEEREMALRPEKTIADLSWLPDEDTEVDENGKAHPRKKPPYLAENDMRLPKETRELAKAARVRGNADRILADSVRARIVARLEPLYAAALKEGRTIDAEYYHKTLKSMYSDWEYKPEETKEEATEERQK